MLTVLPPTRHRSQRLLGDTSSHQTRKLPLPCVAPSLPWSGCRSKMALMRSRHSHREGEKASDRCLLRQAHEPDGPFDQDAACSQASPDHLSCKDLAGPAAIHRGDRPTQRGEASLEGILSPDTPGSIDRRPHGHCLVVVA